MGQRFVHFDIVNLRTWIGTNAQFLSRSV
jgi:hypothetical protein